MTSVDSPVPVNYDKELCSKTFGCYPLREQFIWNSAHFHHHTALILWVLSGQQNSNSWLSNVVL
jgi:hypothetical protein